MTYLTYLAFIECLASGEQNISAADQSADNFMELRDAEHRDPPSLGGYHDGTGGAGGGRASGNVKRCNDGLAPTFAIPSPDC